MKSIAPMSCLIWFLFASFAGWAVHPVLVLVDNQPTEEEFIEALLSVPETNWLNMAISLPRGFTGGSPLVHAVIYGMTNAVKMIINSDAELPPKLDPLFDPFSLAIHQKQWTLLSLMLASRLEGKIDNCSFCKYLELLTSEQMNNVSNNLIHQWVNQCVACEDKSRADGMLLYAMVVTNTPMVKLLLSGGAEPMYMKFHHRVVYNRNQYLEKQLASELESIASIYLSSSNSIIRAGDNVYDLDESAIPHHNWSGTLQEAADASGFRSVLLDVVDEHGYNYLKYTIDLIAKDLGINIFMRDHRQHVDSIMHE